MSDVLELKNEIYQDEPEQSTESKLQAEPPGFGIR